MGNTKQWLISIALPSIPLKTLMRLLMGMSNLADRSQRFSASRAFCAQTA